MKLKPSNKMGIILSLNSSKEFGKMNRVNHIKSLIIQLSLILFLIIIKGKSWLSV